MIDLTRALARFRAFPDDVRIALEGDKSFAGIGPILKLLDGHMVAGLAAGTAGEECPRMLTMRRALGATRNPYDRSRDEMPIFAKLCTK
jgi:hypothetical protein